MKENNRQNRCSRRMNISYRERVMSFLYVCLLLLTTAGCCCFLMYIAGTDFSASKQKGVIMNKMEKIYSFRNIQKEYVSIIDTLYFKINALQPGIHAQYEEDDIKYLLNDLKNVYQSNGWDNRYKVFLQIADFYQMWMTDKKELWGRQQNIINFRKNLKECEIGLESKKQDWRSNLKK